MIAKLKEMNLNESYNYYKWGELESDIRRFLIGLVSAGDVNDVYDWCDQIYINIKIISDINIITSSYVI